MGASPEAVEVAVDGAGDTLSFFADKSCEEEFMISEAQRYRIRDRRKVCSVVEVELEVEVER